MTMLAHSHVFRQVPIAESATSTLRHSAKLDELRLLANVGDSIPSLHRAELSARLTHCLHWYNTSRVSLTEVRGVSAAPQETKKRKTRSAETSNEEDLAKSIFGVFLKLHLHRRAESGIQAAERRAHPSTLQEKKRKARNRRRKAKGEGTMAIEDSAGGKKGAHLCQSTETTTPHFAVHVTPIRSSSGKNAGRWSGAGVETPGGCKWRVLHIAQRRGEEKQKT